MGEDRRRLPWPNLEKARDLGGLPTMYGRRTALGALIRSDAPERLTSHGQALMRDHGVRTVIDPRPHGESVVPVDGVAGQCLPLVPADFPFPIPLVDGYQRIVDDHAGAVGAVLQTIADASPGAVLFHCHSGTGLTGLVTLLLLSIARVPATAIQKDYLMGYRPGQIPAGADAVVPSTLKHLDGRYGGPAGYLTHAGVTAAEVLRLPRRLLGNPEP